MNGYFMLCLPVNPEDFGGMESFLAAINRSRCQVIYTGGEVNRHCTTLFYVVAKNKEALGDFMDEADITGPVVKIDEFYDIETELYGEIME